MPRAKRINRIFSDFVPVASGLTLVATIGVALLVFFDSAVPLKSERLAGVSVGGSGDSAHLIVTRDLCFSGKSEAYAVRIFRRKSESRESARDEVYENISNLIHLDNGCYTRERRVNLPDDLPIGRYEYISGLKFCNEFFCRNTAWLESVHFSLIQDEHGRILPGIDKH